MSSMRWSKVSQPLTLRRDSRLRRRGQRERDARARGRFQRAVSSFVRSKSSALQMDNLAILDLGEEIFVTHYEGSPNHS